MHYKSVINILLYQSFSNVNYTMYFIFAVIPCRKIVLFLIDDLFLFFLKCGGGEHFLKPTIVLDESTSCHNVYLRKPKSCLNYYHVLFQKYFFLSKFRCLEIFRHSQQFILFEYRNQLAVEEESVSPMTKIFLSC